MKVKITADKYKCSPNGYEVLIFEKGDIIEGRAATMALEDKAGVKMKETPTPQKTKPAKPTEKG